MKLTPFQRGLIEGFIAKITSTPNVSKSAEIYLTLIIFRFVILEANVSPATEIR